MMKKKKQSRSQSSTKKTLEPSSDSSPSPRLLSLFRSKLTSGKDLKYMFRGMKSKTVPGLSSQSRIVRCPKCQKLLQEPIDATSYKCGGCDSILHAQPWKQQGNENTIPEALLSSENRSLRTEDESAEGGSKTPMRNTHGEYNSRASPSVDRGYHSETVYKHEKSDIRREWMRRADEFSVTGDSDVYTSARSSPYNSHSNVSEWTQHEERYKEPPQVPFYPASPSPSSAYEYGYSSPFHGSQAPASEQSYYHHHQPNQFKQYGREGSFQESSVASPIRFPGETPDGKYYHWSSQSQLHDPQYHNLHESSSYATLHRSVYSERSYQAAAAPHRYTYSEHSKSDTSSDKSSGRDKKRYVRERKPVVKRHVLPSAGGAPFVTCSYCLELLQLPQVSLHGKHKRYQVRCGSCSGVLKLSTQDKTDTVLNSPSFVDSGTGFVDETVITHQDSASEGDEEIYPDDSHLSASDNGSGDIICKGTNDVILSRNLETCEDRWSISKEILDSELEALQPRLKPSLIHRLKEQQPASTETIGETSRIHLEQSREAPSDLEESVYEKNEILMLEEMVGSCKSLEVAVYKNERMSESNEEAEIIAERPVSHSAEPLNKNEYVCKTPVLAENTRDTHKFDCEEAQEYGGERTWGAIMGDKPGLHLEKSLYIGDSVCDGSSSNCKTFEDTAVKEDTEHISSTFSAATSATPQSPQNFLVNENQRLIEHPDQSGEATFTTSRIHGEQSEDGKAEQSKNEYENLSERQELDKTTSDKFRYELEESRYETDETLEPGKVGEDGSVVSLEKASETFDTIIEGETGEERSASHQVDFPNENVESSYQTLEPVYLEGIRGYAGERAWAESIGDRAGLHLEEYESNYENYRKQFEWTSERAPTFHMHEYELGTILEPEEDAVGRSESSSRGSFNDHESSEESAVSHESQDSKPEQSHYEYENSSERQELSNTVFDIVKSEFQECRYETNETLEPGKMVGVGSVVSLENVLETSEEQSVSHQLEPQNENVENSYGTVEPVYLEGSGYASKRAWEETMGDGAGLQLEEHHSNPFEWTSERAPTFRLHEYELGAMPEPEEDANRRSVSSSTESCSDHESSKERVVAHEEEPWQGNENKTEALKVAVIVEEGLSLHLEKCGNESVELDKTFERTSERAPTFRLHEYELGTTPQPDEDADGRSISSSTEFCSDHERSKEIAVSQEEPWLVDENKMGRIKAGVMAEDGPLLHLEKCENESMKLEETFELTSDRAPTFRLREYELGTMLELDEDADGRSEPSSTDFFNDHESSKVRNVLHAEEPQLVNDSITDVLQVSKMVEDGPLLQLEKCENESMKLDETFEWTSGRALTFRLREYEPGKMLEQDEDADGRSESSSRGSFNGHGSSKEIAINREDGLRLVDHYDTKAQNVGVMAEDGHSLPLEKGDNETVELDEALEPMDDKFRLCPDDTLEKERMMFHLEMSQDKQDNPRQDFKQGEVEEDIPEFGSGVSSEGHESPSKMAEVDSEAEDEVSGDHLEHWQKDTVKSELTSKPYAHIYSTTEPSEIVGLRHALYETQISPLRSPLTSPIHTPIGSPLHYMMSSQIRSPIASPLRSPINSSGSLSDVLFFGKKA